MSTQSEILKSFEKQISLIHEMLIHGEYDVAITGVDNLHTYLQVKSKEIGEGEVKYGEKRSSENGNV